MRAFIYIFVLIMLILLAVIENKPNIQRKYFVQINIIFVFYVLGIYFCLSNIYVDSRYSIYYYLINCIVSIYVLIRTLLALVKFDNLNKNVKDKKKNIINITLITILILTFMISFAFINCSLYYIDNNWYKVNEIISSRSKLAFEFLYYSFNLAISNNETIIAVGIIPKIIRMIYVVIFYIYIINLIATIVNRNR